MSREDIVRAWKDPDHREADVDHPAGEIVLDMEYVGASTEYALTAGCCEAGTGWQCEDSKLLGTCGLWTYGCCSGS